MTYPGKGRADQLQLGDWNCVCYQCGRKRKASTMKRHWQGYWVCPEHWEPRQTQDFVRVLPDRQTPPWVQPMPADNFVGVCTPDGMTAIVDYAIVDCAIVDYISPLFDPTINPLPCNAVYVLADDKIDVIETDWACGCLIIDANLTLDGMIGITHGTTSNC